MNRKHIVSSAFFFATILASLLAFGQCIPSPERCNEVEPEYQEVDHLLPGNQTNYCPATDPLPTRARCHSTYVFRPRIVPGSAPVVNVYCGGGRSPLLCTTTQSSPTPAATTPTTSTTPRSAAPTHRHHRPGSLSMRLDRIEYGIQGLHTTLETLFGMVEDQQEIDEGQQRQIRQVSATVFRITRAVVAQCGREGVQAALRSARDSGVTDEDRLEQLLWDQLEANCANQRQLFAELRSRSVTLEQGLRRFEQNNGRARFIIGGSVNGYGIGDARGGGGGLVLGVEGPLTRGLSLLGRVALTAGAQASITNTTYAVSVQALAQYRFTEGDSAFVNAGLNVTLAGTLGAPDQNHVTGLTLFGAGPMVGAGGRIGPVSIDAYGGLLLGGGSSERATQDGRFEAVKSEGSGWQAGINLALHI